MGDLLDGYVAGDVPPLKGVDHGAPGEALGVDVELTRIA